MNLRAAFEIASTYTMIKQEGEYVDQEAQTVKRTYLDALDCLVTPHQDLDGFRAHIEEARKVNKSLPTGKVNLMTIHQAKGLEFKCVIVPGLNEGILPHVNSVEQLMNLEEERRLMYVAMTRAMERLIVMKAVRGALAHVAAQELELERSGVVDVWGNVHEILSKPPQAHGSAEGIASLQKEDR